MRRADDITQQIYAELTIENIYRYHTPVMILQNGNQTTLNWVPFLFFTCVVSVFNSRNCKIGPIFSICCLQCLLLIAKYTFIMPCLPLCSMSCSSLEASGIIQWWKWIPFICICVSLDKLPFEVGEKQMNGKFPNCKTYYKIRDLYATAKQ